MSGTAFHRRRRRVVGGIVAGQVLVACVAIAVAAHSAFSAGGAVRAADAGSVRGTAADESSGVPTPIKPAFVPGKPVYLRSSAHVSRWAVVRRPASARAEPSAEAAPVGTLATRTPEGTSNIVVVLGDRVDDAGRLWIRVRLPTLGEDSAGWVRREALGGYGTVRTHLVVDLQSLEARLLRDGREIFRADVGVGKPSSPTPTGDFYIRNRLTGYASPMYGPIAFGTSARSRVLTDWPAGGFVGIHGTDQPDLLPGYVSHGCIRMRNADILRLARLMPVGTPLTVR